MILAAEYITSPLQLMPVLVTRTASEQHAPDAGPSRTLNARASGSRMLPVRALA
jgi:hypothetical protein